MDLTKLSDDDLKALKSGNLSAVSDDGLKHLSGVAQPAKKPASFAERLYQGAIKDPGEALAQIAGNIAYMNDPIMRERFNKAVSAKEQEYRATAPEGTDYARAIGGIISPTNVLGGMALKGMGAVNALRAAAVGAPLAAVSAPVTDGDFVSGKMLQAGLGAAGGAAGQKVANIASSKIASSMAAQELKNQANYAKIGSAINKALRDEGVANSISEVTSAPLKTDLADVFQQARNALKQGKELDVRSAVRQAIGNHVLGKGASLTLGQATRDPQQWAKEFSLKGVEGAGKQLSDRINLQNQRLISAIRDEGIADLYDAGTKAGSALKDLDTSMAGDVSAAYAKFRNSTGVKIDVPMQPIVQKYSQVLEDYGQENIPSAVRNRIESYLSKDAGTQTKVFDIDEANKLLTQINAHYDPNKPAQQKALSILKGSIKQSLDDLASESGAQSNVLLREAIDKAKGRFALHESIPALEAAAFNNQGAPEKFLQKYVTGSGASIDSVQSMMKVLPEDAQKDIQNAVRTAILSKSAPGSETMADTATLSQARLRQVLNGIGQKKLEAIFGKEEAQRLNNIQYVASLIQKAPAGALANTSGTAAEMVNMLNRRVLSLPMVNVLRDSARKAADERFTASSLQARLGTISPQATLEQQQAIRNKLIPYYVPVGSSVFGSAAR